MKSWASPKRLTRAQLKNLVRGCIGFPTVVSEGVGWSYEKKSSTTKVQFRVRFMLRPLFSPHSPQPPVLLLPLTIFLLPVWDNPHLEADWVYVFGTSRAWEKAERHFSEHVEWGTYSSSLADGYWSRDPKKRYCFLAWKKWL